MPVSLDQLDGVVAGDIPVRCDHCLAFPLFVERDGDRHYLVDERGRHHAPHCTAPQKENKA